MNLKNWQFSRDSISYNAVTIPHDWAINGPFDKKHDLQFVAIEQNGETEKTEKSGRSGALPWIGRGFYKTTVNLRSVPKTAVLEFDGAMADPHVYINGKLAGHWVYGYNAFRVDARPYLKKGKNEISVSLNNREESSRWYPGGGLYRPVALVTTADEAHLNPWGCWFRTESIGDGKAVVSVCSNVECVDKTLAVETLLLGADGKVVKVKNAYIDWMVPNTDLKLRMGLQAVAMPNVAGGSAIMDGDAAAVVASYQFNDNVGLTALWMRPLNDNYAGRVYGDREDYQKNYLDNMDLFALMLPLKFDGVELTPWAMYGMQGKNTRFNEGEVETADGALDVTLPGYYPGMNGLALGKTSKAYGSMFWAGLPVAITAFDPLNIEFDINYGYVEAMGRYDVLKRGTDLVRGNSKREGWLVKALVEYKMDWGTPGIFGWYASGDDGNVKNGSERLPSFDYNNECTSGFSGFGTLGTWTIGRDAVLGYTLAGTWGFGARIRDLSFIDKLSHTIRVNFYNGTNAPRMARYIKGELDVPGHAGRSLYGTASDFNNVNTNGGIYLTQRDYAAEFGIMSSYQIYDNLRLLVEANYIALWLDQSSDVWGGFSKNGSWHRANSIEDAWNVNMSFIYKF